MIEFDSTMTRRLPVYLVLDTSGSMYGPGIEAVNQGIQLLLTELKKDPMALETAYISCITFESSAKEVLPLTEIGATSLPTLVTGGSTNLAAALRLLIEKLDKEIRPNTPKQKGDYKPLIFLLSDGQPDPGWEPAAAELQGRASRKAVNVIALACGTQVNTSTLSQITPIVLLMENVTPDNIRSFFKWVSQSVRVTSRSAAASTGEAKADLPPLPTGIIQVSL